MIKAEAAIFGRVMTAMVTPFDDQLKLDLKSTTGLVTHLIQTGTTSIVVAGTTGESPTLEDNEKVELFKCVVSAAKGKAKVILGTGSNCTSKSVKKTQEAERLGADAVLVVAPYYNKPSQPGLVEHFKQVANSTKLPVILYNIPGRTSVNMTVETVLEIVESCPNVYALKDSTGNVDQSAEIAGKARSDFHIYSGDDYLTLPFLAIGATGIVSVASHLVGNEVSDMIDKFVRGDLMQARKLHYKNLALFRGLFAAPNPICVKYALSKLGLCKEHVRLPLVPLDKQQKAVLDQLLKQSDVITKTSVC